MARLTLAEGKSIKELGRLIYDLAIAFAGGSKDAGREAELEQFFKEDRNKSVEIKIVYDTKDCVHIVVPYFGEGGCTLEEVGEESTGQVSISGCGR